MSTIKDSVRPVSYLVVKTCKMLRPFEFQEKLLRFIGLPIVPKKGDISPSFRFRLIFFVALHLAASVLLNIALNYATTMEELTACCSIFLTTILTINQGYTYLYYKKDFRSLTDILKEMYQKKLEAKSDNYLEKTNKLANRMGRMHFLFCVTACTYFGGSPIFEYIAAKIMDKEHTRTLPDPMAFPFDDHSTPGYEIAYVFITIWLSSLTCHACAIDGLFIVLALNLRAHFQELQYDIIHIDYSLPEHIVDQKLKEIAKMHTLLLDLSDQLCIMYKPFVFSLFAILSVKLGFVLYQIATSNSSIMFQIKYFSFMVTIINQLFIYCYGGEMIKVEGLNIDKAVQLSDWYEATTKQRRVLCFLMMRSQRELRMKAVIYECSLENFLTMCKAALSFITVIQSFA